MKTRLLLFVLLIPFFAVAQSLPAFPGAGGFAALATGGRGGSVYHVTNLQDSGPGSFRDALSQPKRTVVFDVAGVIKLESRVNCASDITVAGQTAPGAGIVVYGQAVAFNHGSNIIVRYMRFRGSINMPRGACTVYIDSSENVMLDHVSIEWGRWDNLHIKHSTNVTLQYCLIGEALDPQRFGALIERPKRVSIHHCLWMDNQSRNPKAKAAIELVNNVIYNWGGSGLVGGHSVDQHYQDILNNYFIAGPSSNARNFLSLFTATDHVYQGGNMLDTNRDGKLNGAVINADAFEKFGATMMAAKQNLPLVPVRMSGAAEAYQIVVREAGASLHRDAVDLRLIGYVRSLGREGAIIPDETVVGGQGPIAAAIAESDTDGDGIPDAWERGHKLDPENPADAATIHTSGYSNLEVYLNGLAVRKHR